ncbi:MFS transporter [Streptomonospora sp. S1-112]|uniref:MFS transporter n=1 Tax=Streptomonospora mangrovi TaxID=2883123 RepID=A0A9X3NNL2_9ACTN|nr:MFS transporter [Streptomonospora mangrovi]MDA0566275.1 MFS transporter [Streptomonospora mangrovi]
MSDLSAPERTPARARRTGARLALLSVGHLIISLDFTIIFVALPAIARDVGFTPHGLQWVVSAYAIAYGGFLLLGGRLCDLVGRRRMFLAGALLYGAASLLGGLATAPALLLAARVLQGLGGAVLFPAVLSLVNTGFAEGPERNRALTVWALAGAGGLSLGALAGGLLTQAFGWEAVFFVNVPIVAGVVAGGVALLAADGPVARGRFDVPGTLTGTAGITLLILAVAQGGELGWTHPLVLAAGALAPVLLAVFAAVEARTAEPLVPLRLFRNPSLVAAVLVILVFGLTAQNVPYFLTLFLQEVLGFGALESGLAFLAPTLAITLGNFVCERMIHRMGVRAVLLIGFALGAVGAVALGLGMVPGAGFAALLPGVLLVGLAMGLVFEAMWVAAGTGVPDADQGLASGVASTAVQVGLAAGLAVLVTVADPGAPGAAGAAASAVAAAEGMRAALYTAAGGMLLGLVAALRLPGRARPGAA